MSLVTEADFAKRFLSLGTITRAEIRELALSEGGLLSNEYRKILWIRYLGIKNEIHGKEIDIKTFRDYSQVLRISIISESRVLRISISESRVLRISIISESRVLRISITESRVLRISITESRVLRISISKSRVLRISISESRVLRISISESRVLRISISESRVLRISISESHACLYLKVSILWIAASLLCYTIVSLMNIVFY